MTLFPSREVFLQIGDYFQIRWYAVCILTGALAALWFSEREGQKSGYKSDIFDDIFIGGMLAGIIGSRLWYCIFYDFSGYFSDPISIFEIWDGGLAIQGGLFGGALFGYLYCKINHYSFFRLADIIVPYVLFAQACGRWGNFFNQEAYGGIVSESYYDGILSFLKSGMYIAGNYREPMFFYESCGCLIGLVLIELYKKYSKTYRGDGLFCYLSWYGLVRFFIEAKRTDSLMFMNLKMAQVISVIFMIIGIAGLLGAFRKPLQSKKPVVVFDLDGTLLDTHVVIEKSFEHTFEKFAPGLVLTDEDRASFMGPTLEETFRKYNPDGNVDEEIAYYRQFNQEHQKDYVVAFEHTKMLLDYLKENNYRMAIASSKITETIRMGLDVTGLSSYFTDEQIIGYEQIINAKPDPEGIFKAIKALNGSKDCAIYVGDSNTDILAAHNAGVYSIAYLTNVLKKDELTATKPNKMINGLDEVIDILKEPKCFTNDLK